jgi:hypothetical protein
MKLVCLNISGCRAGAKKLLAFLHADADFLTGRIEVRDFRVLPDEVSEHAPLEFG